MATQSQKKRSSDLLDAETHRLGSSSCRRGRSAEFCVEKPFFRLP